jgi:hypothetical protein
VFLEFPPEQLLTKVFAYLPSALPTGRDGQDNEYVVPNRAAAICLANSSAAWLLEMQRNPSSTPRRRPRLTPNI